MSKILKVRARQVFDSRGNPTVEAEVYVKNNSSIGIGAGQMNRLDSAKIGAEK